MKTFAALFVCDGGEGSYLIALYVWEITRIMKRNHIRLLDAEESLQLSSIIFSQDVMVLRLFSCEAVGTVPGSNPQNVHYSIYRVSIKYCVFSDFF